MSMFGQQFSTRLLRLFTWCVLSCMVPPMAWVSSDFPLFQCSRYSPDLDIQSLVLTFWKVRGQSNSRGPQILHSLPHPALKALDHKHTFTLFNWIAPRLWMNEKKVRAHQPRAISQIPFIIKMHMHTVKMLKSQACIKSYNRVSKPHPWPGWPI